MLETALSGFKVDNQQGFARATTLPLRSGIVQTPVFMPVGTYGAVKGLTPEDLKAVGSQIILSNTYHLIQTPGLETLNHFGGISPFMNWKGPLLTDSGGFQVFSLSKLRKINDDGVKFCSPKTGTWYHLTPEKCAEAQQIINSDIAMILDECVALPATQEETQRALYRSIQWTERFLKFPRKDGQRVFGIIQGGTSLEQRKLSTRLTQQLPVDGIAIGGLSVGEPQEVMLEVLDTLAPLLDSKRPHYLMGVGTPLDILEGIKRGIDMFDCVMPSRNARHGSLFTWSGVLRIKNETHKMSTKPIDSQCPCECCQNYSRGYMRHLFKNQESLGMRLATLHNLTFYHQLMARTRESILDGSFDDFAVYWCEKWRTQKSKPAPLPTKNITSHITI